MKIITTITLAAIAIMMAAVAPQEVQARPAGKILSPTSSINNRIIQTDPNPAMPILANPLPAVQNVQKIVTKFVQHSVYIGSASLEIPASGTSKYYAYSETGTDPLSGSTLTEVKDPKTTSYNVQIQMQTDGKLTLYFKNLKVEKNSPYSYNFIFDYIGTAAVVIKYNGKAQVICSGENTLKGADNTYTGQGSTGFFSSESTTIGVTVNANSTLTATGGNADFESNGMHIIKGSIFAIGKLTATGGEATYSDGLYSTDALAIKLQGGTVEANGGEDVLFSTGYTSRNSCNIQGNGTFTATGGKAKSMSSGAYTEGNFTVDLSSGSVIASGGEATQSNGSSASKMIIKSGIVTLQGHTNVTKTVEPKIYAGAKVQAGLQYDGSDAGAYDATQIGTYQYLHIGSTLKQATVDAIPDQDYTGSAITPKPVVKDGDNTLVEGTDYTLSYSNNTDLGTATVTITGKGNYLDTQKSVTFTIVADMSNVAIAAITEQAYSGYAITPKPTVTFLGNTLVEGRDYTVSYVNNVDPGTATITITGKGLYKGTRTVTFTINEEPATDYAYVNLPYVEGLKTDPIANMYAVTKGESFTFTLTLKEGYGASKPIVTANRKEITPNDKGEYVISNITENQDITITGITATGVDEVSAATAIRTSGRTLNIRTARPQQLQVISIIGKVALMRNIPAGDTTISTLAAGIYIVRLADGTMAKVILR